MKDACGNNGDIHEGRCWEQLDNIHEGHICMGTIDDIHLATIPAGRVQEHVTIFMLDAARDMQGYSGTVRAI